MNNPAKSSERTYSPQVKVCGLTRVAEALACAESGADAIGCVFYPKSPRHVTDEQAFEISRALPQPVKTVGVFVNESFADIMRKVERCRLGAVQLHGREAPELVDRLLDEKLLVIKALFSRNSPSLDDAVLYRASAFLIECGRGPMPGGNAEAWNWKSVEHFGAKQPFILAGGLDPQNICHAASVSSPDAVDVSSGVESEPGRKDRDKVKSFFQAVSMCALKRKTRRIF